MLDRFEPLLKIVCAALAALLVFQVGRRVAHPDPIGSGSIPNLPKLSAPAITNAPTVAKEKSAKDTNSAAKEKTGKDTNSVIKEKGAPDTNSVAKIKQPKHRSHFGGMMPVAADLPAAIQTRVDKIKESEILGPFMRPPPMALLGIADDDVFLRAPDGQTKMIKEGDEVSGVKLLRIGTNRVLVEENGEKKELTLFEGYGGESLLPPEPQNSTNGTNMPKQKENP